MGNGLFEHMSVRVIVGLQPGTGKLIRSTGLITEIKSSGICTCEFEVKGRSTTEFFYTETLVSIRGPEQGGWLERLDQVRFARPDRSRITGALFAAKKAFRDDDKDALLQFARDLCSCEGDCGATCGKRGSCQRMFRVRDALRLYAAGNTDALLSEATLRIEDYLTP